VDFLVGLLNVLMFSVHQRPCQVCGSHAGCRDTECERCGLDIVDSGPVVPARSPVDEA
jgi:hypothetical protein